MTHFDIPYLIHMAVMTCGLYCEYHCHLQYNGSIWKGGRLRLEKAKENYLDRLKREWAEDAQLVSSEYTNVNDDVVKERDSLKKPNETHSSKMKQLRMFFPRLQKVTIVPLFFLFCL